MACGGMSHSMCRHSLICLCHTHTQALLDLMASRFGDLSAAKARDAQDPLSPPGEQGEHGEGETAGASSGGGGGQDRKNRPEAMNGIFSAIWKNFGHKLEGEMSKHLQKALDKLPFASLKCDSIKLGKRAPWIRELKKLATRSEQEIQIVGVVRWVMEDGAGIQVKGHLKQTFMPTSLNLEHFDVELPIWIRLRINQNWGRAPEAGQVPDAYAHEMFTSIAVSALARPKILFDIGLAGSKITAIPALRDGLYAVISQALDKGIVSPNKILIQKAPDNHVINFPHAVGVVHVNVMQCIDLPAADWSTGQCDPYGNYTS